MTTQIKEAFLSQVPSIEKRFTTNIQVLYGLIIGKFGINVRDLSKACNSNEYARRYMYLKEFLKNVEVVGETGPYGQKVYHAMLNEEYLIKRAHEYAVDTATAWYDKVMAKVGDLKVEDYRMSGSEFSIRMNRGDDVVTIDQKMIINVSSRGVLFNQFPSIIRVNGKRVSEANFKAQK